MTTAKELLKLIETVDPNDAEKLDEIDARVWCYLNNINCVVYHPQQYHDDYLHGVEDETGKIHEAPEFRHTDEYGNGFSHFPEYTRSRDVLKAIRPKGWEFENRCVGEDAYVYHSYKEGEKEFYSPVHNEELSELCVIILAIDYERSK